MSKKLLILAITATMMLGVFGLAACTESLDKYTEDELEMTAELEAKIKTDYLAKFGYTLFFGDEYLNKFYGIYNGVAVFFIAGADAALKTVTISGVTFSYNYGWTILVWKDGVFHNLEQIESIFGAGILTQSDLEQIGIAHAQAQGI